jgi:hypothetical protein
MGRTERSPAETKPGPLRIDSGDDEFGLSARLGVSGGPREAPVTAVMTVGSGMSSGSRWTYVASVKAAEWCPMNFCTCFGFQPSRKSSVAAVCRSVFGPAHGTPASFAALFTAR